MDVAEERNEDKVGVVFFDAFVHSRRFLVLFLRSTATARASSIGREWSVIVRRLVWIDAKDASDQLKQHHR